MCVPETVDILFRKLDITNYWKLKYFLSHNNWQFGIQMNYKVVFSFVPQLSFICSLECKFHVK